MKSTIYCALVQTPHCVNRLGSLENGENGIPFLIAVTISVG